MTVIDLDRNTDSTAALLTPRGRGAVATIRVCGDDRDIGPAIDRHFQAVNGRCVTDQPLGRICFGHWRGAESSDVSEVHNSDASEEVVVCRAAEAVIEIHCHGGDAAVNRILALLAESDVRSVTWQQQRATLTSAFAAECHAALTRATTDRTVGILLEQASGLLCTEIAELLDLASDMASDSAESLQQRLGALNDWGEFGRHLTEPWRIVLAGRPNVGKSTLINALLGYARAIVYDQPGTTRDVVAGETAFEGWPIQLADTAGIRETGSDLELEGIERTRRAAAGADLVCLLIDVSQRTEAEDEQLREQLISTDARQHPSLIVAHKSDLPRASDASVPANAVSVSSVTGAGTDELMSAIVRQLVPRMPPTGTPIPVTARQIRWLKTAMAHLTAGDREGVCVALRSCLDGTA